MIIDLTLFGGTGYIRYIVKDQKMIMVRPIINAMIAFLCIGDIRFQSIHSMVHHDYSYRSVLTGSILAALQTGWRFEITLTNTASANDINTIAGFIYGS